MTKDTIKIFFVDDQPRVQNNYMEEVKDVLSRENINFEYQIFSGARALSQELEKIHSEGGGLPDSVMIDYIFGGNEVGLNVAQTMLDPKFEGSLHEEFYQDIEWFMCTSSSRRVNESPLIQSLNWGRYEGERCINKEEFVTLLRSFSKKPKEMFPLLSYFNYALDLGIKPRDAEIEGAEGDKNVEALNNFKVGPNMGDTAMQLDPDSLRESLTPSYKNLDNDPKFFRFRKFSTDPIRGKLCFNSEDIESALNSEDKAIIVLQSFNESELDLINNADGVVVIGSGSSHALEILRALNKPYVTDLQDYDYKKKDGGLGFYPCARVDTIDGELALISMDHRVSRAIGNYISGKAEAIDIDYEGASDDYYLTAGNAVTLVSGDLVSTEVEIDNSYANDEFVERLLDFTIYTKYLCKGVRVSAAVDSADVLPEVFESTLDIGLIRSEHLILGDDTVGVKQLLKEIILSEEGVSEDQGNRLKEELSTSVEGLFEAVKMEYNGKFNIRLFDLTLDDFFTQQEIEEIHARYGEQGVNGTQLANQIEGLYEAQIDVLMLNFIKAHGQNLSSNAYESENKDYNRDAFDDLQRSEMSVMLPHVKTAEDVVRYKEYAKNSMEKAMKQEENSYEVSFIKREKCLDSIEGYEPPYKFGAMVETLEACENIEDIARECDFISIGANDLTSAVLGIARNDIEAIRDYQYENDGLNPFETLCPEVKERIKDIYTRAKAANPDLEINLCGRQGADIEAIKVLDEIGFDSVSVDAEKSVFIPACVEALQYHIQKKKLQEEGKGGGLSEQSSAPNPQQCYKGNSFPKGVNQRQ